MAVKHFGPDASASDVRSMSPPAPSEAVTEILAAVKAGGDSAVRELELRFGGKGGENRVSSEVINAAPGAIDSALLEALKLAISNVRAAASSNQPSDAELALPQGQQLTYRSSPVARAAAYVPGGRGSYPSTAIMCLTTAIEAGVPSVFVLSPARENGEVDTAVLAVCALLGIDEVYSIGGAQAIAAAAYGTETIEPADVIVGPGNAYVQEAKRQLVGTVGIDSVAGPSELVVVADSSADPELISLDLLAQAEHGPDSLVVLICVDRTITKAVERRCGGIEAELALVSSDDLGQAVQLAEAIAPEHLQLMVSSGVEDELASSIKSAGALFVGANAATAFGDYVTGSNHVLPTGGSARFMSALSTATFRRRMAEIRIPDGAVDPLAEAGAAIARAEGFTHHAESMEARRSD